MNLHTIDSGRGTTHAAREAYPDMRAYDQARLDAMSVFSIPEKTAAMKRVRDWYSSLPSARSSLDRPTEADFAAVFGSFNVHHALNGGLVECENPHDHSGRPQRFVLRKRPTFGNTETIEEYIAAQAMLVQEEPVLVHVGNVFLNEGTEELWNRLTGVGTLDVLFDNSNARIGVGSDGATAAVRTQTGLQGVDKSYAVMEAGFPTVTPGDGAGGAIASFKGVYDGNSGNHDHKEWVVDNKAAAGTITMNRFVQDFGTKLLGAVWTYTFQLRIN